MENAQGGASHGTGKGEGGRAGVIGRGKTTEARLKEAARVGVGKALAPMRKKSGTGEARAAPLIIQEFALLADLVELLSGDR